MAGSRRHPTVRLLCPKKSLLSPPSPSLRWLVGSPRFLPPLTVAAALRCLPGGADASSSSPDLQREADEIRGLLVRGFDVVGALHVGRSAEFGADARGALELARALRERLSGERASHGMVGGCVDAGTGEIQFLVSEGDGLEAVEAAGVVWEDEPGRLLWEKGCLLRCELPLKLPLYASSDDMSGIEARFFSLIESTVSKLRDPHVSYLIEGPLATRDESHYSVILHGNDLDSVSNLTHNESAEVYSANIVSCSKFFPAKRFNLSLTGENADAIQITILSNQSFNNSKANIPVVEYFPAPALASLRLINLKLDILCYSSVDLPVAAAVSELVIPGLADQLNVMKKAIVSELTTQQPQLCPYHFVPPGLFIPVTAIYDTRYGEIEEKQSELRRNLHLRLQLPLDRPLLRISNALKFSIGGTDKKASRNSSSLLRDVHREIPSSGVSGGIMSLIDGSYEYYHYLHDGIDDNGWGCAYRSLQTIVSWYKLQQYSSINVPSHREIQQVLVEIGDKDSSFIGSREWIGAIELSFVLDKLLGASCKIINVRSGDELPEKCRELAIHFETQGTPVMIGGGVLAYTLLGVDYNETSGDCAFLILDPHYTGSDDLKKIVNGGWCGWKKSVDSKGCSFFLKDKFYNLLLPQRPNMV
ncbi:probable Ufm1-specific protease [Oryza brachyantha]|uniref:Probable Ufm1-specific protease n=1 Tax=Oryza brachyantha TaxID=4533 RepID=J3NCQ0_ORYBR|nr:probable Ufm1-specific protease [Oryza brachyantha]